MGPGGFTLVDVVVVIAAVAVLLRGFRQGALSQVASFAGAVVGLVVGSAVAPELASLLVEGPSLGLSLTTLTFLIGLVLAGQVAGLAVGLRLRQAVAQSSLEPIDRVGGMGVGLAGLIAVIWVLGAVLSNAPVPEVARHVRDSAVVAVIDEYLPPPPDVFGRVAGYLDDQGFPQVFSGPGRGITAPPVPPTSAAAVQAAAGAAQQSTVQVQASGCGALSSGSGFVTTPGFVVTNAHVVAGGSSITVADTAGNHEAVTVHFDPDTDVAVLAVPSSEAPPIGWVDVPADREVEGATLGYPSGQREQAVKPATVRGRGPAVGRDIYGRGQVERDVLTLAAPVVRGDSGGPFVTSEGRVGGVVFAADAARTDTGYALSAESVRGDVESATARNHPADTGPCRF